MNKRPKGPSSKGPSNIEKLKQAWDRSRKPTNVRTGYADPSHDFADWVNSLGLERTWWGRLIGRLEERFHLQRFSAIFLFCLALAWLVNFDMSFTYVGYELGNQVTSDLKTPVAIEVVDDDRSREARVKSEATVLPVFDFDPGSTEAVTDRVYRAFEKMRVQLAASGFSKVTPERAKSFLSFKKEFQETLDVGNIPNPVFEWLTIRRFDVAIENATISLLEEVSGHRIVQNLDAVRHESRSEVRIRLASGDSTLREFTIPVGDVIDVEQARARLQAVPTVHYRPGNEDRLLRRFAQTLIVPNMKLNNKEWTQRKKRAYESVPDVKVQVRRNQVAIPSGTTIEPVHLRILEAIESSREGRKSPFQNLMLASLFVSMILVFTSFLRRFTLNRVAASSKDLWAMGFITVIVVLLTKMTAFLTDSGLAESVTNYVPKLAFLYLAPIAAGPMLVGLVIASGEVVWIYSVFQAVVLSFQSDSSFSFVIVAIASGLAGARGVFNCKKRNDIYFAGLRAGGVAAIGAIFLAMTIDGYLPGRTADLLWVGLFGLVSGLISSTVTFMLIPLIETVFTYTTDVRLLELGNLNHPLLKDMVVRAPGTYHHSLVVGSMVEAAAEEIGANPLLAKVSSYYHDIGKTEHSAYFIENQRPGHNPHDHLSPYMSKTILVAHVKDGVELALQHKLGKPIQDVILQHHGTTLISFFYNRAKERIEESEGAAPTVGEFPEEEFRYPGPKPQFREAALCMLADSIEAAARSLDEPTPARLQNIVKNIIQRKFMDGQLEECNLTLRDLSIIEEAFNRILLGIYHQRIDYPRSAGGGAADTPTKPVSIA
jgi:putative nucleotidyltransferase with HDIG domain